MKLSYRWVAVIFVVLGLLLSACASSSETKENVPPAKLEPIAGTDFSRVVLTEKATERLDIQTVPVGEEPILGELTVGGQVIAASDSSETNSGSDDANVATTPLKGAMMVRVPLTGSELSRVNRSQPALVMSLDDEEDSDDGTEGLEAEPDESRADDDSEEDALYYVLDSAEHGLAAGQPVLVELALSGRPTPRKVVPYDAVLYGVNGETWVYTSPEPLVFVRQPIVIDHIEDDLAILSEGPDVGTAVVTVGAAELFGAETGVSK